MTLPQTPMALGSTASEAGAVPYPTTRKLDRSRDVASGCSVTIWMTVGPTTVLVARCFSTSRRNSPGSNDFITTVGAPAVINGQENITVAWGGWPAAC